VRLIKVAHDLIEFHRPGSAVVGYHAETYEGFEIKAYVQPVSGGCTSAGTVRHLASSQGLLKVKKPSVVFATDEAAMNDVLEWARGLVNEMLQW
jgi:hypothetical protein